MGNSFLAGHNVTESKLLFSRIDEIVVGDKVNISTIGGEFSYVVYDIEIVSENDRKCFEKLEGERNLSLVTCTNKGDERLIIYCKEVN